MSGAFPAVKDELKGAEWTVRRVLLFLLGLCIPVALGAVSAILSVRGESGADVFANIEWWQIVLALAIGYVVGVTQIVPGLSASAFLMAVGWFGSLMASVSMTYWRGNMGIFLIYAGLGVGFLLGLFTFSKLLTYLFGKARHTSYSMIVGLSLGSILSMFCNGDIMEVYVGWMQNGVAWLDLALGLGLFAVGVVGAYLLVRYQRKKDAEEGTQKE
jgi:putative membrane protein